VHRPGQNLRNPDWPVLEKLIKDDLKSLREVICAEMPTLVCKWDVMYH
jgi:hypothetical protein